MTRRTAKRIGGRALVGAAILALASAASASPGNGIRLGGSVARLHPYLELESRWDSNVAFSDVRQKESGFILHVRPGLTLSSPGDTAAVDLKADLDWAQYLGKNSDLSRLYGEAQLGLGFNRRGSVGLEISDGFRRSSSTQVQTLGGAVVENTNDLAVHVPFRPGGGAFITTLAGGWRLSTFEPFIRGRLCPADSPECDPAQVSKLDYSDVSGGVELRWKFLPRTAALVSGEYWKRFPSDAAVGSKASGLRAWAGLAGLFSSHVAGTVKGGYGTLSNAPGSKSSWLANLEAEWLPLETTSLKLGYLHDLGVDPGASGGYASHRAYAEARALLAARYTALLSGSFEHRDYDRSGFAVDLFQVTPSLDVEVARWLRVGAGMGYTKRSSKLPAGTAALPGFSFDKTEAFLRVRGTY